MQSINVCNSSSLSFPFIKQNNTLLNPNFTHRFNPNAVVFPRGLSFSSSPSLRIQWNPLTPEPKIDRFHVRAMKTVGDQGDKSRIFTNTLLLLFLQWLFRITDSISNCVKPVAVVMSPVSLLSFFKQKLASHALRGELMMKNKFEEWALESGEDESIVNKFKEWMLEHGRVYKDANEKQKRYLVFKEKFQYIEAFNNGEDQGFTLGHNDFSDMTDDEFLSQMGGKPRERPWITNLLFLELKIDRCASEDDISRIFTDNLAFVFQQWLFRITDSIADCVERVAVVVSPVSLLFFFKQKLASLALRRELMMKNKFEEWVLESGEDESIVNKFEEWMLKHRRVYKDANEKQKRYLVFKENFQYIEEWLY